MKLFISDGSDLSQQIFSFIQSFEAENAEHIISQDFSFSNFLKKEMQSEVYSYIIISLNSVKEDIKVFSELLEQYLLIYAADVIVLCDTFEDKTIKPLLEAGITNIICSSDLEDIKSELSEALTRGIDPLKWIRLFPEDEKTEKKSFRHKAWLFVGCLVLTLAATLLLIMLTMDLKSKDVSCTETETSAQTVLTAAATTITTDTITVTTVTTVAAAETVPETTTVTASSETTAATVTTAETTTASEVTTTTVTTKKKPVTSKATTTQKITTVTTTTKAKPKVTTTKPITSKVTTTTKAKPKTTTAATTVLPPIPLRGLSLKTTSPDNTVTIKVGETTRITPVFTPEQATNKKVYFSSNREDRAIVDSSGIVIGRSPGAVIIQCRSDDGGLTAACMVVVEE